MNIVLTGFMASGKTSVSKAISELSEFKLIDTDDMITEHMGMSINDIFERFGEEKFREIEHEIIKKAAVLDGYVISTGGGVPLNKNNMDELSKNGVIVNLSPDFDVILNRLENARSTRPLLKDAEIDEIRTRFLNRKPFYERCDYSIRVTDEKKPCDYAREILGIIGSGGNV